MGESGARRRGLPLREVLIAIALLVVLVLLALPVIRTTRTAVLDHTCAGNLKQWAQIFAQYRAEHDTVNPMVQGFEPFGPAANAVGCSNIDDAYDFAPEVKAIFPEYANDYAILACPDGPGLLPAVTLGPVVFKAPRLDPAVFRIAQGSCPQAGTITRPGASYTYLGYEFHHANDSDPQVTEEQARLAGLPVTGPASVVAYLARLQVTEQQPWQEVQRLRDHPMVASDYLQALGPAFVESTKVLLSPLSEMARSQAGLIVGVDRSDEVLLYPTSAVMWDAIRQDANGEPVFTHNDPPGCNVLFMDGHVEFKTYPGNFPVTRGFATMKAVR